MLDNYPVFTPKTGTGPFFGYNLVFVQIYILKYSNVSVVIKWSYHNITEKITNLYQLEVNSELDEYLTDPQPGCGWQGDHHRGVPGADRWLGDRQRPHSPAGSTNCPLCQTAPAREPLFATCYIFTSRYTYFVYVSIRTRKTPITGELPFCTLPRRIMFEYLLNKDRKDKNLRENCDNLVSKLIKNYILGLY